MASLFGTPRHSARAIAALACCLLAACSAQMAERQGALQEQGASPHLSVISVQLEPCVDRTDGIAGRDLAQEATEALRASLLTSKSIRIAADGQYKLTCDVERYVEGSAAKRWAMPGWGATVAGLAVAVWDEKIHNILTTVRSQASVSAGGLYTVDAEQTILRIASDDAVKKLLAWAGPDAGQRKN